MLVYERTVIERNQFRAYLWTPKRLMQEIKWKAPRLLRWEVRWFEWNSSATNTVTQIQCPPANPEEWYKLRGIAAAGVKSNQTHFMRRHCH